MPLENPRIAELRRRVEADPSSIAFAQLAEEYRRAGNYQAAEQTCRTGLARHPGYLSARVTLGRTLIERNQLDQAEQELQFVLKTAPDNLAAIRGMAEIEQRRGNLAASLEYYRRALPLARHDPELEETVNQIKRDLGAVAQTPPGTGLSFAQAQDEFLSFAARLPAPAPGPPPTRPAAATPPTPAAPTAPVAPAAPAVPDHRAAPAAPESRTAPAARSAPSAPDAPDESPIDFDSLVRSLGLDDRPAPPVVEALLAEPAPAPIRPDPVLPELPIEQPADDPFAELERSLQAFDPPSRAQAPDASFGVASPASRAQAPDASFGVASPASRGQAPDASFGVASSGFARVEPAPSDAEAGLDAPSAPAAPEPDETEQRILDELEAWLAAIKR